jgi:hypothetical protein
MTRFRSWDFDRFWKTLAFFEAIPLLSQIQKMFYASAPPPIQPQAGLVFDFSQPGLQLDQVWGAVDDVVMGGVSVSSIRLEAGRAVFTGLVSTNNNGGFASVRTRNFEPPLDLSGKLGLELRLKGDGQRYKFLVRDDSTWDSVAFAHSFNTVKNQWITVRIPFAQLVPVMRAKTLKDGRSLDTRRIRALQLMLSKFEYDGALNPAFTPGEFRLELATIEAF